MDTITLVPELSIELIESGRIHRGPYPHEHYSGREITELLDKEGYTNLGWVNNHSSEINKLSDNIRVDTFREVYSNWSGNYCVYIDNYRRYYCVDMGD